MHIACKLIAINYLFLLNYTQSFHDKAIAKEIDNTIIVCPHCDWNGEYHRLQVKKVKSKFLFIYSHVILYTESYKK